MKNDFIQLTSQYDTPLYFRKSAILIIEGFTFANDHQLIPNHIGSRITLSNGQWGETAYCKEASDIVINTLELEE
jgi:hypothetical protein